ncbi:MAG: RAMP superfamily CRISPR-associated protein [bacterium]
MFKRLLNECTIPMTIRPEGAMLIKSGMPQIIGIDMAWVRVFRNGQQEVYLPGSSLKGMLRAHSERIARTTDDNAACNPFSRRGDRGRIACGEAIEKRTLTPEAYKQSCPICRMYGNTLLMGRLATEDAYVTGEQPITQQRDGVGIDRFTGGASRGAKFELEVITGGEFKTTLHLQNFEIWQLGLLGFVLQDLRDGLVRLGSGKSRGLGKIKAEIGDITFHYHGMGNDQRVLQNGQGELFGVGELFEKAGEYGMATDDHVEFDGEIATVRESPFGALRQIVKIPFEAMPWQALTAKWVDKVESI